MTPKVDVVIVYSVPRQPDNVQSLAVPALDVQWIETTHKKAALKLEKLDMDLKNYKSNSIKESIRSAFVFFVVV